MCTYSTYHCPPWRQQEGKYYETAGENLFSFHHEVLLSYATESLSLSTHNELTTRQNNTMSRSSLMKGRRQTSSVSILLHLLLGARAPHDQAGKIISSYHLLQDFVMLENVALPTWS
jgi:hypothetical protein